VFAVYMTNDPHQSFFQLGGYDTTNTYYDGKIKWLDVKDNFFWEATISGIAVGSSKY